MDFDPLEIAGIGGGGRFDDAEGAVGEPQRGDGDVFDFDPLVGERRGEGLHFGHRAHQPASSRSTLWMAWFIRAPPPSRAQVPRQAPLS